MHIVRKSFISPRFWIVTILLAAAILPFKSSHSQEGSSQFVLFLEKAPRFEPHRIIQFTALNLSGDVGVIPQPLQTERISTDSLATRQYVLAQGPVEAGNYFELQLTFHEEFPDSDNSLPLERTITIPLNLTISDHFTAVVFLKAIISDSSRGQELSFTTIQKKIPPAASQAFVSNEASDNVFIFDRVLKEVVGALAVDRAPRGLAVAPRRGLLFVANALSHTISVVNLQNRQLFQTIRLDFGDEPEALCLSLDEQYLFCANRGSNSATIIDTRTLNPLRKVTTGASPVDISVDPWNGWVYVVNQLSDNVTYFHPGIPGQTGVVSGGSSPCAIEFEPRQQRAYLANYFSGEITLINTQNQTVTQRYTSTSTLVDLCFDPFSNQLYGLIEKQDLVTVFKPSLNLDLAQIPVGASPGKITLDPEGSLLWVTCRDDNVIYLVNKTAGRVEGVLPAGLKPYQVVFP